MPLANNLQTKKDKNALSANWEANLLVKDRISGKLKRLRFRNHDAKLPELLEDEEEKEKSEKEAATNRLTVKLAPAQGHFMPLKLLSNPAGAKATLSFHPDDEAQLAAMAQTVPVDDSKQYSVEKIVGALIAKQDLNLDHDNRERLTNILFDFFRNRKRFINVRELLTTTLVSPDGLLAPQVIDSILSIAKGIKARLDAAGGLVVRSPELLSSVKPDTTPVKASKINIGFDQSKVEAFRQALEQDMNVAPKAASPWTLPEGEIKEALKDIAVPAATSQQPSLPESSALSKKTAALESAVKEKEPEPMIPAPVDLAATKALPIEKTAEIISKPVKALNVVSKKTVTDVWSKTAPGAQSVVRARHVLTGPVEELANLSLGNFRRLGEDNQERADKIREKIKVLEHDSFTKKTQGLEAWRHSPVYQLYLQLGLESMQSGQAVTKLIEQQPAGQDMLSYEEFMTIADLNKKLRFL